MKTPTQEELLGYVLGALDAQEQRDVQQSIDDNPEIEEQLLQIKNAILPLDCLDAPGPRPGLARRTCESVAGWQYYADDLDAQSEILPFNHSIDSAIDAAVETRSSYNANAAIPKSTLRSNVSQRFLHPTTWSIPDVLVGIAIIAIMAGIFFPAISYTRYNSRIAACQYNLTQVGVALNKFSSVNGGQYVSIPRDGKLSTIGCFGPILKDSGFLPDDSLLSCAGVASTSPVRIPTCAQVNNSRCDEEMDNFRRTMGGHFGYTMGYRIDDRYYPPRNRGRTNVVLVADQPSCLPGRVSSNHGGSGQNLLFEDGRVQFVVGPAYGEDAIFENDYGIVGPGSHPNDNVIAPSHLSLARADWSR